MPPVHRRLPHITPVHQPLFITFRLHGTLPRNRNFPPGKLASGKAFATLDRLLDQAAIGPTWLNRPQLAELVAGAIHHSVEAERVELHAWAIMPNHVHLLVTPTVDANKWLKPLKGFTAHRANQLLGLQGKFWQEESYDHVVRTTDSLSRITRYIENNPVKAGLSPTPEAYPWSSATTPSL